MASSFVLKVRERETDLSSPSAALLGLYNMYFYNLFKKLITRNDKIFVALKLLDALKEARNSLVERELSRRSLARYEAEVYLSFFPLVMGGFRAIDEIDSEASKRLIKKLKLSDIEGLTCHELTFAREFYYLKKFMYPAVNSYSTGMIGEIIRGWRASIKVHGNMLRAFHRFCRRFSKVYPKGREHMDASLNAILPHLRAPEYSERYRLSIKLCFSKRRGPK